MLGCHFVSEMWHRHHPISYVVSVYIVYSLPGRCLINKLFRAPLSNDRDLLTLWPIKYECGKFLAASKAQTEPFPLDWQTLSKNRWQISHAHINIFAVVIYACVDVQCAANGDRKREEEGEEGRGVRTFNLG